MSDIKTDTITDQAGTGSPDFPQGIKVADGTEGLDKVLTSDAAGVATWQAAAGAFETTAGITSNSPGTIATDDFVFGAASLEGASTRMMFDKAKGAFRVGSVNSDPTTWDDANRGINSMAWGDTTRAFGLRSTSWGNDTGAAGTNATSWGYETAADGNEATAFGYFTEASGLDSTAWGQGDIGQSVVSSGEGSTAWGFKTTASGDFSTAFGSETVASGDQSVAWGNIAQALGLGSIAIGLNVTVNPDSQAGVGLGVAGIALGSNLNVEHSFATALGSNMTVQGICGVGIGLGNGGLHTMTQANAMSVMGGNVGVGELSPSATLDLVGTFQYTDTNQALGRVLTSDAAGNATWQAPAGGGGATPSYRTTGISLTAVDGEYLKVTGNGAVITPPVGAVAGTVVHIEASGGDDYDFSTYLTVNNPAKHTYIYNGATWDRW